MCRNLLTTAVVCFAVFAPRFTATAATREVAIVESAASVLDDIMSIRLRAIPSSMLANAQGIAIIPKVLKGGLVFAARRGKGVVLTRAEDGNWQGPVFVTLTGGSVGWQVGVQSTDVILVFKTRTSVDALMRGKLTMGVDAAAAAGPVGRNAAVATDGRLQAEIYSYSRSRGLFAGVSLDGSILKMDHRATAAFFEPAGQDRTDGRSAVPPSAIALVGRVVQYSSERGTAERTVVVEEIPAVAEPTNAGTSRNELSQAKRDFAAASRRLDPQLDAGWKRYLAIPSEAIREDEHPSTDVLQQSLKRFDRVAADPKYRVLSDRVEFQSLHQSLRRYLGVLQNTASERGLPLPPPPSP